MTRQKINEEKAVAKPTSFIHIIPRPIGRPPRFNTPVELWERFVEYCDYTDGNPWQVKTASNSLFDTSNSTTNNSMRQEVRVFQRAYTLTAFCAYAGIATSWSHFKQSYKTKKGFEPVLSQIENIVMSQQLDGAMINQFNGSLVARLNGISEVQETKVSGSFTFPKLTEEDLAELRKINGF